MKKRKGIQLEEKVLERLQKLADNDNQKLKPYMERVLINHSVLDVRQKIKKFKPN